MGGSPQLNVPARGSTDPTPAIPERLIDLGRRAWDSTAVRFLLVLLVVYVAKQALTVVVFPPFSGHDEVAHYSYIGTVATERRVPSLFRCPTNQGRECLTSRGSLTDVNFSTWSGDMLPDYFYRYCQFILQWDPCEPESERWLQRPFRAANWGFIGEFPAGTQYVANHPPLYYVLIAPAYQAFSGFSHETRQYLIRVLSIPFGMLTVILAFLTVRTLFPGELFLAITVPSFVAFQPQVSYEAAMVNNDIVGIALVSLILFLIVRGVKDRFSYALCGYLGFALGIGLLAKSNSAIAAPAIAIAVILTFGVRRMRLWLPRGLVIGGIAGIVALPWYVYLWRTYGNIDGFEQIETLQAPWNRPAGSYTDLLFNRAFLWARWNETWGEFGWRRIHLDSSLLWYIAVPMIITIVGLSLYVILSLIRRFTERGRPALLGFVPPTRNQAISLVALFITCVIAYLAIIQFGTRFALTQARYYFPAVNAVAILLMLGLRTLTPVRLQPLVRASMVFAVVFMNLVIYTRYVIPYWHILEL